MKSYRTIISAVFITVLAAAAFFVIPRAIPVRAADACTITADDLGAIQKASKSGLIAELATRRILLIRTINCAKADAVALQKQLNNLPASLEAKTLQFRLSEKLDDAMTFYDLESRKAGSAGLAGTQAIAREVLEWRAANYEPIVAQVENFTLWMNNQSLFKVANDRMGGIINLVGFIQQAGQNNELQGELGAAQSLMETANKENLDAKNSLFQSAPAGTSAEKIQQSLSTLSDVYQKFFDIATLIGKILPSGKSDK